MSDFRRHAPLEVLEPQGSAIPLVYDSPHSGTLYPDDFGHVADAHLLRGGEDRFVDDLVAHAPSHGITLIRALFARTYIDPNREPTDLDLELASEDWPDTAAAGDYSPRGVGLIFRMIGRSEPIYARRLPFAEVQHRIDSYWQPYHSCLEARLEALHDRHGSVWHIDWHSMRPVGDDLSPDPGKRRADFVLGDLHGRSCAPAFTQAAKHTLEALGYSVAVNMPFSGAYVVRRHGDPDAGRHSLQIEINRALYLDPDTLEAGPGMSSLQRSLGHFSEQMAEWIGKQIPGSQLHSG